MTEPFETCEHHFLNIVFLFLFQDLKAWHQPRIKLLMEAGVDLLAIETIPCLAEALAIIDIMNDIPGCRGWITFSCKVLLFLWTVSFWDMGDHSSTQLSIPFSLKQRFDSLLYRKYLTPPAMYKSFYSLLNLSFCAKHKNLVSKNSKS